MFDMRHADDQLQFGRRIEPDGSWTVYHVFSGRPAALRFERSAALSRRAATRLMLSLNRHGSHPAFR